MKRIKNPITRKVFDVLLATGFKGSHILDIEADDYSLKIVICLPIDADSEDFERIVLQNMKEEFKALDIKISKRNGKIIDILLGMRKLDKGNFDIKNDELHPIQNYLLDGLKIKLPSAYGDCVLDFEDGSSCHMLNGGTTRMGKTCMLLYLCCVLFLQEDGKIKFYICSSKVKDFFPLFDIPQFDFADDAISLLGLLNDLTDEYETRRNNINKMPALRKCKDSKDVRKHQPNYYHLFKPIFLIIDEYADYSHVQEIQKAVENLVRKGGYINIHIIISTQRADARTTIPPAIKCCLGARLCFTTTDVNNSIVILDQEGAERLGDIEGRAILLDSGVNMVQVPFMDTLICDEIMEKFRSVNHDSNKENKGSTNSVVSEKVSNLFKESDSEIIF